MTNSDTAAINGDTAYAVDSMIYGYSVVTIQPFIRKNSGTPNAKIELEGSADGVTYYTLIADTIHVGNVTGKYSPGAFTVEPTRTRFWRPKITSRGTANFRYYFKIEYIRIF